MQKFEGKIDTSVIVSQIQKMTRHPTWNQIFDPIMSSKIILCLKHVFEGISMSKALTRLQHYKKGMDIRF